MINQLHIINYISTLTSIFYNNYEILYTYHNTTKNPLPKHYLLTRIVKR